MHDNNDINMRDQGDAKNKEPARSDAIIMRASCVSDELCKCKCPACRLTEINKRNLCFVAGLLSRICGVLYITMSLLFAIFSSGIIEAAYCFMNHVVGLFFYCCEKTENVASVIDYHFGAFFSILLTGYLSKHEEAESWLRSRRKHDDNIIDDINTAYIDADAGHDSPTTHVD